MIVSLILVLFVFMDSNFRIFFLLIFILILTCIYAAEPASSGSDHNLDLSLGNSSSKHMNNTQSFGNNTSNVANHDQSNWQNGGNINKPKV